MAVSKTKKDELEWLCNQHQHGKERSEKTSRKPEDERKTIVHTSFCGRRCSSTLTLIGVLQLEKDKLMRKETDPLGILAFDVTCC